MWFSGRCIARLLCDMVDHSRAPTGDCAEAHGFLSDPQSPAGAVPSCCTRMSLSYSTQHPDQGELCDLCVCHGSKTPLNNPVGGLTGCIPHTQMMKIFHHFSRKEEFKMEINQHPMEGILIYFPPLEWIPPLQQKARKGKPLFIWNKQGSINLNPAKR